MLCEEKDVRDVLLCFCIDVLLFTTPLSTIDYRLSTETFFNF